MHSSFSTSDLIQLGVTKHARDILQNVETGEKWIKEQRR